MRDPIVFLPGMMCDARLFGPQLAMLGGAHMLVSAPVTQGERIEEIASGLLDGLPRRFALVGYELGGIVAMELLRRAPDRITRLALCAVSAQADTPEMAAAREPEIIRVRAGRLDEVMRARLQPQLLAPSPYAGDVLELMAAMAEDLGPDCFVRQSRALQRRRDQQSTLRKCRVPTRVIVGADDPQAPLKRQQFIADLIPHAELDVIEQAGHVPSLEAPEAFTDALRAWLAQPLVLR